MMCPESYGGFYNSCGETSAIASVESLSCRAMEDVIFTKIWQNQSFNLIQTSRESMYNTEEIAHAKTKHGILRG